MRDVRIANPPWASRTDLARVETLEITVQLLSLLRGRLVIPRVVVSDADVLLEEGSAGQVNWAFTLQQFPSPVAGSAGLSITVGAPQIIEIVRGTLAYRESGVDRFERALITEARLHMIPEEPLRLTGTGQYRQMPLTVNATGGSLANLFAASGSWPLAFDVATGDATLTAQGNIGIPIGMPVLDLQVKLEGEHLSALNSLLAVDCPELGPYDLSGRVRLADGTFAVTDLKVMLGSSDLAGEVTLNTRDKHAGLSASLASRRIDLDDFRDRPRAEEPQPAAAKSDPVESIIDFLKTGNGSINATVENIVSGDLVVQNVGLQAILEDELLRINLLSARLFGSSLTGHTELNVHSEIPSVSLALAAKNFDYGRALIGFGAAEGFVGMSDVAISAMAEGSTWETVIGSLTVTASMGESTFLVDEPLSGRPTHVWIKTGRASISASKPGQVVLDGSYRNLPLRIELTTGPSVRLFSDQSWPVRLVIHAKDGHLMVRGLAQPLRDGVLDLSLSGEGRSLASLTPRLPAVGPYHVTARVTGDIRRFRVTNFTLRVAESDVAGQADIALGDDRVAVTGQFNSRLLRAADFVDHAPGSEDADLIASVHGDAPLAQVLQPFDGTIDWHVDRFSAGPDNFSALAVAVKLNHGQVAASCSTKIDHGGVLKADLALESSEGVSVLGASAQLRGFNYGRFLHRFDATYGVSGSTDVELSITSRGRTLHELRDQLDARLAAKPGMMGISKASGEKLAAVTMADVSLEARPGRPLLLSVHGDVESVPLSLTMTTVPLRQWLDAPRQWPLRIVIRGPDLLLEAVGELGSRNERGSSNFRVSFSGTTLKSLAPLLRVSLPDEGPYEFSGDVTVHEQAMTLSDFRGRVGASDVAGRLHVSFKDSRPGLTGALVSQLIQLDLPKPGVNESLSEVAVTTLQSVEEEAVEFIDPLEQTRSNASEKRVLLIPDVAIPIETIHRSDVDLHWAVKRFLASPLELDNLTVVLTIKNGVLTMGPVSTTYAGGDATAHLHVDSTRTTPRIHFEVSAHSLDYGRLLRAFQVVDQVEGNTDLTLLLDGVGSSLRGILAHANGSLEIAGGPGRLPTRYVDLWAANLITAMFSQAWRKERVTQYHCAVGYFEISNGEMQSDVILVHAPKYTIAAAGSLTLGSEELDLVLTPAPQNMAFVSVAVPVRVTGPLARPQLSTNAGEIAKSKAWRALNVVDPLGLAMLINSGVQGLRGTVESHANVCVTAFGGAEEAKLLTEEAVRRSVNPVWYRWAKFKTRVGRIFGGNYPPEEGLAVDALVSQRLIAGTFRPDPVRSERSITMEDVMRLKVCGFSPSRRSSSASSRSSPRSGCARRSRTNGCLASLAYYRSSSGCS